VIAYFALNTALTFWVWAVEKGNVWKGATPRGGELELSSSVEKHIPIYSLSVTYVAPSSQLKQNYTIKAPFSRWFRIDGTFAQEPFRHWLASEIPAITEAEAARGGGSLSEKYQAKIVEIEEEDLKSQKIMSQKVETALNRAEANLGEGKKRKKGGK
jgi:hypothetical protein